MSNILKVHVRHQGDVHLTCPKCMDRKTLPANVIIGEHKIKIICSCKYVIDIELEYRKKFRKKTELDGYFEKLSQRVRVHWETQTIIMPVYNCVIKNLSVEGVGFTALDKHNLQVGDLVHIRFYLDNSARPMINKIYQVRGVRGSYIGCKNFRLDEQDKDLAFYLLS